MRSIIRKALPLGALALLFFAAAPAGAIKLENYQKYRLDSRNVQATFKSLIEIRMEGVLQGLLIANRAAVADGGKPLFCPPDKLEMRGADVVKLLDSELTAGTAADGKPYSGDTNIEDVMLKVAQKRWPCTR